MKKLILLPFLVFGQFLANAQKTAQRAQQMITMNLLPAGPVHIPKLNNAANAKGKDKKATSLSLVEVQDKNVIINTQVIETGIEQNDNGKKSQGSDDAAKNRSVIYTITSL